MVHEHLIEEQMSLPELGTKGVNFGRNKTELKIRRFL